MISTVIIPIEIMKIDRFEKKLITARQSAEASRIGDYGCRASVCALACERRRDKG